MSYASKSVAAIIGLLVMAVVFGRQLFLFTTFRDPQGFVDSQGGKPHLWLSLFAAAMACIAGALVFYFFGRHRTKDSFQSPQALPELAIAVPNNYPSGNPPVSASFDKRRWAELNPWLSEGQSDDRRPMDGSVADGSLTSSGQRTRARESHQLKFKKWSQARRD